MRSSVTALTAISAIAVSALVLSFPDNHPAAAPPKNPAAPATARNCIAVAQIRAPHVRDDRTIDFELVDGKTMRNRLPYACPQLAFEKHFSYTNSLDRLCSTDIITVLVSGNSRGASCGLGMFRERPSRPD